MNSAAAQVEDFLAALTAQRRASPHTVAAYRRDLGHLLKVAEDGPLTEVDVLAVRRAIARLHSEGLAPTSIARLLSAWRSFFDWLIRRGLAQANPASGVRAPRAPKKLPKALSADQAVSFVAQAPGDGWLGQRDRALVELMYSSGLRLSELVSLDMRYFPAEGGGPASSSWLDVDGAQATITGKGRKTRVVPIGSYALAALKDWLAERDSHARPGERALFVSARGQRLAPRSVQARFAELSGQLGQGFKVHPHVLRHSFASHVLQSSGDLRAVQELLGHANIATTQIYTKLDWQHLAKAYDAAHPRAKRKPDTD